MIQSKNQFMWSKVDGDFETSTPGGLRKAKDIFRLRSAIDTLADRILPNLSNRSKNANLIAFVIKCYYLLETLQIKNRIKIKDKKDFGKKQNILENLYLIQHYVYTHKSKSSLNNSDNESEDDDPDLGVPPGKRNLTHYEITKEAFKLNNPIYDSQKSQGIFACYRKPLKDSDIIKKDDYFYVVDEHLKKRIKAGTKKLSMCRYVLNLLRKDNPLFSFKNNSKDIEKVRFFNSILLRGEKSAIGDLLFSPEHTKMTYNIIVKKRIYRPNKSRVNYETKENRVLNKLAKFKINEQYKLIANSILCYNKLMEEVDNIINSLINELMDEKNKKGIKISEFVKRFGRVKINAKNINNLFSYEKRLNRLGIPFLEKDGLREFLERIKSCKNGSDIIKEFVERNRSYSQFKVFRFKNNKTVICKTDKLKGTYSFHYGCRIGAMLSLMDGGITKSEKGEKWMKQRF